MTIINSLVYESGTKYRTYEWVVLDKTANTVLKKIRTQVTAGTEWVLCSYQPPCTIKLKLNSEWLGPIILEPYVLETLMASSKVLNGP